ncbi:MAG: restriction endonuclease subunit S [Candidatus Peregrinibacteria bacterium]
MKNNWQTKKLGDICNLIGGGTPSKSNRSFYDGDIPWATVRDMKSEIIVDTDFKITREAVKKSSTNVIPKNNVVIASRVGLGKVCFLEIDAAINQDLRAIIPKNSKELNVHYLFWWLKSIAHLIEEEGTGATVKGVKLPFIKSLEIPLPPLPEQHRIVKILDEAFAAIAKAKENAKKNLRNARELFESYLQGVFVKLGEGWEEKQVNEICEVEYGYTEKAKSHGDYRFVRITDTNEDGLLTQGSKMYINSFDDANKYVLANGDLLMARTGASAGNLLLFEGNEKAVFASYLIRMKFKKEILSKLYWYFSKSKLYWDQVRQLSAGSAQPQFNGGALKQIVFPFPKSLPEQRAIVAKLDALSGETKKLEAIYKQKLANLEELKKSVLKKAFAGEL